MNKQQLLRFIKVNKLADEYNKYTAAVAKELRQLGDEERASLELKYLPIDWQHSQLQTLLGRHWFTSQGFASAPDKLYLYVRGKLLEVVNYREGFREKWLLGVDYTDLLSPDKYGKVADELRKRAIGTYHLLRLGDAKSSTVAIDGVKTPIVTVDQQYDSGKISYSTISTHFPLCHFKVENDLEEHLLQLGWDDLVEKAPEPEIKTESA